VSGEEARNVVVEFEMSSSGDGVLDWRKEEEEGERSALVRVGRHEKSVTSNLPLS